MKWYFLLFATLLGNFIMAISVHVEAAEDFPLHPITLVVPWPAGGNTDAVSRALAQQLEVSLSKPVVVDNRGGANGQIGAAVVARAAADGYTLLVGSAETHSITSATKRMAYDPDKDFESISILGMLPFLVAAHPSFPANGIAELVAAAKAKPNTLNMAVPALPQRIGLELLRQLGGAQLFPVPYKGSAAALTDVIGGQLPLILDSLPALKPHIDSGKIKALGISTLKPSELMPGVKPIAEQGMPGYEMVSWIAMLAPKGTPAAIVTQLNTELRRILQQPETRQRLGALGVEIVGSMPNELAERVRTEREKWGQIIRSNSIQTE
jgi:tripartite-type tricarboxylate transporter receptor subunit TctC